MQLHFHHSTSHSCLGPPPQLLSHSRVADATCASLKRIGFRGVHLGKFENETRENVQNILLQKVLAYVDEGAGSAVVGEFVDKRLGLLNKAFDGG